MIRNLLYRWTFTIEDSTNFNPPPAQLPEGAIENSPGETGGTGRPTPLPSRRDGVIDPKLPASIFDPSLRDGLTRCTGGAQLAGDFGAGPMGSAGSLRVRIN